MLNEGRLQRSRIISTLTGKYAQNNQHENRQITLCLLSQEIVSGPRVASIEFLFISSGFVGQRLYYYFIGNMSYRLYKIQVVTAYPWICYSQFWLYRFWTHGGGWCNRDPWNVTGECSEVWGGLTGPQNAFKMCFSTTFSFWGETRSDVFMSMRSQGIGHDLKTEQQGILRPRKSHRAPST